MEPDVITYSALITACEKSKKSKRAVEIFEAMNQQGVKKLQRSGSKRRRRPYKPRN